MGRLSILALGTTVGGTLNAAEPVTPVFTPVQVAPHVYDGGWEHFVGGGVAVFDCNGDSLPELFVAGGENPAELFVNTTPSVGGQSSFIQDTPVALKLQGVIGAYPLDLDGDRVIDLAILRVGHDMLMRGTGDCGFTPFQGLQFTSQERWTTAFSATWEPENTLPTLAFGTYVDRSDPDGPFEACDDTLLYRPHSTTYGSIEKLSPGHCALSALFTDWNRSGSADLRLSNDRHYFVTNGQEQLWDMQATPRLFTESDGWIPYSLWGMGIASRDINGDGFQDVYLTSMGDQKFQLRDPNSRGPVWRDVTYQFGTTAQRPYTGGDGRPSTGWHAAFGDANNDGRDDIFVAKGNVEQMPDAAQSDPNNLMIQTLSGTFVEVGDEAGLASMHRGRGAAFTDLNLDGFLDVVVVNRRAPMEIWQNQANTGGNWLLLSLIAPAPNTFGVGAFIELDVDGNRMTREVTVGGGHAGGELGLHHFGLGTATRAKARVIWPDDTVSDWYEMKANTVHEIAQ